MSLFSDDPRPSSSPRRPWVGPVVLLSGVAVVVGLGVAPAPYVIEQPGPVFDTLGSSKDVPLISIPDRTTYPTAGTLDMLTVSVVGNPQSLPTWVEVASAWFDRTKAVVPVDAIFPPSSTVEERDEANQAEMTDSQQEAIAAALTELGYPVEQRVSVVQVPEGSPAEGVLEAGDEILAVAGTPVADATALRATLQTLGTGSPVQVSIEREGARQEVEVTPRDSNGAAVIGVLPGAAFDFPFEVDIQLDDVGGPSAGMMFALGIIDKLTEGELNGGRSVAGTGTIDAAGEVGAIGGIRQKLYGAEGAGAEYFLAPATNCNEVVGHVPDGLDVLAVSTLDDALAALKGIAAGDTSGLPDCSTAAPLD
ncbi:ATP-dependent serine peptidase containing a PDZ domain protein [Rathayibacter sp. AY1E8]|uniref:YlbL family protein n=1 Tax=unclassified Rathayibacter TaxID=2609250 RepID=UPI000CE8F3E4|nr:MULTISPECIES: PDZ domain-containing protein [unclassified Rathayibacter]PPG13601.1 ATP-dependent serine peptidase containing a PDZ domain protein [Rathayibacter sp. AY1E8]PPG85301.1 ATP-dependent serine peptidase containing a PDZ domain protein [Rathayibacter sp. AY1H2]PPI35519.1 ATP-dependent serine peptidase containing a PDZ domain protein [Rathayibacter sp. RFBD1]PPI51960.1 ATP-dependent serine peptidase containing a PDZ domain protein [Rathayibacter sp. TRS19]